jgi:hypothetical protein
MAGKLAFAKKIVGWFVKHPKTSLTVGSTGGGAGAYWGISKWLASGKEGAAGSPASTPGSFDTAFAGLKEAWKKTFGFDLNLGLGSVVAGGTLLGVGGYFGGPAIGLPLMLVGLVGGQTVFEKMTTPSTPGSAPAAPAAGAVRTAFISLPAPTTSVALSTLPSLPAGAPAVAVAPMEVASLDALPPGAPATPAMPVRPGIPARSGGGGTFT